MEVGGWRLVELEVGLAGSVERDLPVAELRDAAVIELVPRSQKKPDPEAALEIRIRQQRILAELGVTALQGANFETLLAETVRLVASGLESDFSKVMEYIPSENRFLVRAGVGWGDGVVGHATVGADLASPAGYALKTGSPVISNHLADEERFRTPELFTEYGIRRAMNVILQGNGSPFGILEVDSRSPGEFSEDDIDFLQGAANLLGMAIERERHERDLRAALDTQQLLMREINHRAKNSLQIVASLLHLQAKAATDPAVSEPLRDAGARVTAVGRAYGRLSYQPEPGTIDLGAYLTELASDIIASLPGCEVHLSAAPKIEIASDRAILVALVTNELVTNVAKHAYPGKQNFPVWIELTQQGQQSRLSVRDEGIGLPSGFPDGDRRLGARVVRVLAEQLRAELRQGDRKIGLEVILNIPIE